MEWYILACSTIGALCLSTWILKLLHFISLYSRSTTIMRYHHNHSNSSAPPWAIITGSTDGIGKAYAYELADRGFNIVLHGRNPTKLHHVRHELQNEYPHLSFRIILADASKGGPESLKHIHEIVESLRDLHVTILINNVGTGAKTIGPLFQEFSQEVAEDIDELVNINARFPAQFTKAVIPLLLSHGGPALILTMGSLAEIGMPYLATYAAAKSFDLALVKALRREMQAERRRVEVLGIMTGPVTDVSWDKSPGTFFRVTSRTFAHAALDRVGCGEDVVAGCWQHGILWWAMEMLPSGLADSFLVTGVKTQREKMTIKEGVSPEKEAL